MRRILLTALVLSFALAAHASAQTVQRPSRPYRGLFGGGPPPDPNRTRTELTFTGSVLVGHDTYLSPGSGAGGIDAAQEPRSGRTFTGEAALAYFHGRAQRSLSIDGRALSLGYSGIGVDPTLGGYLSVIGNTNLGRVMQLRATQNFAYDPTLVLGGMLPTVGDTAAAPQPDVTSGYLEQRSWTSNSGVTLDRRWTPRHTMQLGAEYVRSTFLDEFGYDTSSIGATASHNWQFSRTSSIRGLYSYVDVSSAATSGLTTPMTNQQLDASFGYARRLSPTRNMSLSISGGATHVNTLNAEDRSELLYWMPSGSGSFSLDLGRSWSVAANYTRSVNVLQGISLTSFAADSARININGLMSSRIETSLSASYSNGQAGGANTTGRYENYIGSLQLRYAFSRRLATAIYYDYYVYDFQNVSDLPSGFLTNFDRQAIRVGFTLWLPIFGSYADGNERGRGAR